MYLLTIKEKKDDGAYAVQDKFGDKVLFLFQQEDDADRYALMLNEDDKYLKEMEVIEVDDELAIKTCMRYNYKYSIITPNDFVIPPTNDNVQED